MFFPGKNPAAKLATHRLPSYPKLHLELSDNSSPANFDSCYRSLVFFQTLPPMLAGYGAFSHIYEKATAYQERGNVDSPTASLPTTVCLMTQPTQRMLPLPNYAGTCFGGLVGSG